MEPTELEMNLMTTDRDGESRVSIPDDNTQELELENLPIEVLVADIDSVLERSNDEFALIRKQGLGGSDSSAVLGVNPYNSRTSLIQEKARNKLTQEELEVGNKVAVRKGRDLEPIIIQKASKYLGYDVFKPKDMYRFKDTPWLTMNFDGVAREEDGQYFPVEIKVVTMYGQKHYDFNKAMFDEAMGIRNLPMNYAMSEINTVETKALQYGIPPYYYTQLQQEMMALDAPYGLLSVLRDSDWRFFTFYIHKDPYVQSRIITEGYKVWEEVTKLNPERKIEGM